MASYINPEDPVAARAKDIAEQYNMFVAFWLGSIVYGVYVILFAISVKIGIKTGRVRGNVSGKIFSFATGVLFILTTTYMVINASRFLAAFDPKWTKESNGQLPIYSLRNYSTFRGFGAMLFVALPVWLGDALAIYRCFIIWDMDWKPIFFPVLLLLQSFANGAIHLISLAHPTVLTPQQVRPIIAIIYPVNISQSCLTTGLITYKIGRQYFASRRAGLSSRSSDVGLLTVMRIIVESTMISTVQQVIMCILYQTDHPTHYLFFWTLIPSVGVAVALLTIRVHEARDGPRPSIHFPETTRGFGTQSLPHTRFSVTPHRYAHSNHRGRNHRRTVSDGALSSPFSVSTADYDLHPGISFRSRVGERVDLESGRMGADASTHDVVLAMNHSSKTLS